MRSAIAVMSAAWSSVKNLKPAAAPASAVRYLTRSLYLKASSPGVASTTMPLIPAARNVRRLGPDG